MSRFLLSLLALPALLALASSCATTTGPAKRSEHPEAAASRAALEHDLDARRAVALEVAHLDGLDAKLRALSSLHVVLGQSFRGAHLRDLDVTHLPLAARARLDEIRRVTRDTYREDSLRAELVHRFAEREGATQLAEVRTFLRGAASKRLSDARTYIRTPPGQTAFAAFLAKIASHAPDDRRLSRVRELLSASREVELMSALSFTATRAMLEATDGALPPELSGGYQRWLSSQQESAQSFEQEVTRTLLLQDYFALQALSEKQINEVLSFWRSDAGQWWSKARVDEIEGLVERRAQLVKEELQRRAAPEQ